MACGSCSVPCTGPCGNDACGLSCIPNCPCCNSVGKICNQVMPCTLHANANKSIQPAENITFPITWNNITCEYEGTFASNCGSTIKLCFRCTCCGPDASGFNWAVKLSCAGTACCDTGQNDGCCQNICSPLDAVNGWQMNGTPGACGCGPWTITITP